MHPSKKSSMRYLAPLILVLILHLAWLAPSAAQTGPDQTGSGETEASASTPDAGDNARHGGRAGCDRCEHRSGSGDEGKGSGKGGCDRCNRNAASGSKGRGGSQGHPCAGDHQGPEGSSPKGRDRAEMQNAHFLVTNHDRLERSVEDIPDGVRTETTTEDPELLEPLRQHVREMSALLEGGGHIRKWDPLFAEIFEHGESIRIEFEDLEKGIRVTETSEDEEVVKLIRAHARKIDQFVAAGQEACREETPLPDDYARP